MIIGDSLSMKLERLQLTCALDAPWAGPDWAGQEAQERPGLLKDTNRWEAALEGGALGGIEKADRQGLQWAQSTGPDMEEDD
ncbi:hypothetical protein EYF80_007126 [Liparis tanakae]|uniref:Uncharacterized protein n=1 Tax=Liparis tanakae TaxID=230148 RepID=A0A4Z2IYN8_9TELE|nr:hypothetical protein EYF80_007126 [Liparis tanakae]